MTNSQKKVTPFQIIIILFFAGCLICTFSFSRQLIITFMEKLIGRELQEMTKWNAVITGSMSFFAFCAVTLYYFLYIPVGKTVRKDIFERTKSVYKNDHFAKHLIILFLILLTAYAAILRANYDFFDDMKRIISGHKSWVGASRYVSEICSVFLHTNFYLNDISPLSQIIALAICALTAYILCYILTGGKITYLTLAASSLFALCPYYIENMSFKFDSPYMAMAVLFAVLPFLFKENHKAFISVSIIGLILVMSSYQAANSVYIILAIICTLETILFENDVKKAFKFAGIAVLCFIIALVIFRLFIMIPTEATIDERNTHIEKSQMLSLVLSNLSAYLKTVTFRYGNIWSKLFTVIIFILFPFTGAINSKAFEGKHFAKFYSFGLSLAALILMYLLSFGAYLIIGNTLIYDRAFMGFDILIAVTALFCVFFINQKKALKITAGICVICLLYGFMVQATVAGNLYSKQKKYEEFRYTILLKDLSEIIDSSQKNKLLLDGEIGYATKTHMEHDNYNFVSIGSVTSGWAKYILQDWNMDLDYLQIEASSDRIARNPEFTKLKETLPVIKDTYYHKICGQDNIYYVYLKNPQVKEYEIKE
ncbi:glucosyltransferase domain-containing protein [Treponema sp. C6A8]|uniref:glucosyltransferase domain-containing protein n=1 Tax=Treponema sp. C6A8 TaxID=1410609 RepID=UPI0018CC07DF|nr:glucosyltransferase domain-containing protein [Treponema sp. C6A8]